MGSFLSFPVNETQPQIYCKLSQAELCKKARMSSGYCDENPRLIPNLPDEISLQILARVPRICHLSVKAVSRKWKDAVTTSELFQLRKELGTAEEWLYILTKDEEKKLVWNALDPLLGKWQRLPPMPDIVCSEEAKRASGSWLSNVIGSRDRIGNVIRGWLGRMAAVDRVLFCGCAIVAVDGCLYVLGGFSRFSAMSCVLRYNPIVNSWQEMNSMSTGRAFCKASFLNDKLYVVGGVSRDRGGLTPLRSGEVFDPRTGMWLEIPHMPFSRAQALPTAFLAEMLKPIATGMTTYRKRLCVPQSLYSWPFFVDVGGEIYDPETDSWADMPAGMGEGWPAKQAGTKLSVVVDGELYALDPSSSLDDVKIKMYNHQEDSWKVIIDSVPVHDFTDSEYPYLLAGFLGKLHLITKEVDNETVVLEADLEKCISHSPSTTSSPVAAEADTNVWKIIAAKNFGAVELISCEVLVV